MVASRALRTTACASCRLSILRSFTSFAGSSIRAPQFSARSPRPCTRSIQQYRLASQLVTNSQAVNDDEHTIVEGELEEKGIAEQSKDVGEEVQASPVPWYLQGESSHKTPKPLSERQSLPDLPDAPPPILQPLMQQISIDLGIDDLSLLDLRKLDPPPALGANLLMLLGTARSEKHLHVSADRLCRWLRSNYKLRPDADGLLGRNELKLKLKRKAKRAKLMGSANDENGDDGVRTGWVCVDIGVVEGAEGISDPSRHEDFVGFGRRTDGVRIVVQMLTEEKREEIDLEKLWSGILKRGDQAELESDVVKSEAPQLPTCQSEPPSTMERPRGSIAAMLGRGQTREFHTSARRLSRQEHSSMEQAKEFDLKASEQSLLQDIISGDYEKAINDLRQYGPQVTPLQRGKWKLVILKQLRIYLEKVPRERAIEELGAFDSSKTTPYLTCFNEALSSFPNEFEAETRIWQYCFTRELGHEDYTRLKLFGLFEELNGYGVKISLASYLRLLKAILRPAKWKPNYRGPSPQAAEMCMKILQTMYDQGFEVLNEDILVSLQEVAAPEVAGNIPQGSVYTDLSDTLDLPSLPMSPMQARLHALIMSVDLPLFRDVSRMRLMDLYARLGHWKEFFEVFRMAPNHGKPQSANVYAFMFGSVAQTGYQKSCMAALRTWIPDLEAERPAIELDGDVGEAIRACLRIADPFSEQDAIDSPDMKGEWLSLWRRIGLSNGEKDPFLYE